jgi:hypothetical protein
MAEEIPSGLSDALADRTTLKPSPRFSVPRTRPHSDRKQLPKLEPVVSSDETGEVR